MNVAVVVVVKQSDLVSQEINFCLRQYFCAAVRMGRSSKNENESKKRDFEMERREKGQEGRCVSG